MKALDMIEASDLEILKAVLRRIGIYYSIREVDQTISYSSGPKNVKGLGLIIGEGDDVCFLFGEDEEYDGLVVTVDHVGATID